MATKTSLLLLASLCAIANAQIYVPVYASAGPAANCLLNYQRSFALAPDGTYWALLRIGTDNVLYKADACNPTVWTSVASTPTTGDGNRGGVVTGADCCTLHVLWEADDGGSARKVFHQTFDTCTETWNGAPLQVSPLGYTDPCYADDIELTASGEVAIAFTRQGGSPSWSGWLWTAAGGTVQINTDLYGVQKDIQAVGELLHIVFRTDTGLYGIRYRGYDMCTGSFVTPNDQQVHAGTATTSCTATDQSGGVYVLYFTAGRIEVEYSTVAGTSWGGSPIWGVADTGVSQGNHNYYHATLATGPGDLVYAVYSLESEGNANLYYQEFHSGLVLTSGTVFGGFPAETFAIVSGFRATQGTSGVAGMITDRSYTTTPAGAGEIAYFEFQPDGRSPGRFATRYGAGCDRAGCGTAPTLDALTLPTIGASFGMSLGGAPAGQAGVIWLGATCVNLDLGVIGMPDCTLNQLPILDIPVATDASGAATFVLPILSAPPCMNLRFQAAVLAPGANALGVVTSNGLSAILD